MRETEQARAEAERTKAVQDKLGLQTELRTGGLGLASLRFGGLSGRRGLTSLLGGG